MSVLNYFKFKKYSASISVTIPLGNFEMIKMSEYAPTMKIAKDLLIINLKTLGNNDKQVKEKISNFIHRVFEQDFHGDR